MQVALAWLLDRSSAMLVIPGTSKVKHLEENVAAAELDRLTIDNSGRFYWDGKLVNYDTGPKQLTDRRGRSAHDQKSHEEGELSSDHVTDSSEHQRAKRANGKADGESCQSLEEIGRLVSGRIELGGENCRQTSKDIEVVPLDHCAGR